MHKAVQKAISLKHQKIQSKIGRCKKNKKFLDDLNKNAVKYEDIWKTKILRIEERYEEVIQLCGKTLDSVEKNACPLDAGCKVTDLDNSQLSKEAKKRIQSWSTNEQLLVRKVYEYIRGVKPTVSWCSVIWNPTIPPKMSFILWLAKRNRLLTLDKVAFLNKGSLCPLCSNETESNAHLFFSCRKSLQVWAHIRDLASFRRRFTSLQRITDSLIRGRSTSGVQGKLRCLTTAITVYCIWLYRNKLIFEDYQFSVIETLVRYQLPVVVIVFNNGGDHRHPEEIDGPHKDDPAPTYFVPNAGYHALIQAFGGKGYLVGTRDELKSALSESFSARKPDVVNVVIDPYAGSESGRMQYKN
ncbi:2-hydroxyacyl-CoA lyase [Glycine soja]